MKRYYLPTYCYRWRVFHHFPVENQLKRGTSYLSFQVHTIYVRCVHKPVPDFPAGAEKLFITYTLSTVLFYFGTVLYRACVFGSYLLARVMTQEIQLLFLTSVLFCLRIGHFLMVVRGLSRCSTHETCQLIVLASARSMPPISISYDWLLFWLY